MMGKTKMFQRLFNVLLILTTAGLLSLKPLEKVGWKWSEVKEFRYYGSSNPLKGKSTHFVKVNKLRVRSVFHGSTKSNMHVPVGFSRYAELLLKDGSIITIQMIPGSHLTFRVIDKNIFSDDWYKSGKKGGFEYFKSLDTRLE